MIKDTGISDAIREVVFSSAGIVNQMGQPASIVDGLFQLATEIRLLREVLQKHIQSSPKEAQKETGR